MASFVGATEAQDTKFRGTRGLARGEERRTKGLVPVKERRAKSTRSEADNTEETANEENVKKRKKFCKHCKNSIKFQGKCIKAYEKIFSQTKKYPALDKDYTTYCKGKLPDNLSEDDKKNWKTWCKQNVTKKAHNKSGKCLNTFKRFRSGSDGTIAEAIDAYAKDCEQS